MQDSRAGHRLDKLVSWNMQKQAGVAGTSSQAASPGGERSQGWTPPHSPTVSTNNSWEMTRPESPASKRVHWCEQVAVRTVPRWIEPRPGRAGRLPLAGPTLLTTSPIYHL